VEAIVEEAHRLEMRVASHAHGAEGIKTALRGGVDTIEHGMYIDDEGIELILRKGAILVPTLAIVHQIVNRGPEMGVPGYAMEKARAAEEAQIRNFRKAHEAGVPLAVGTDFAGGPGVRFGDNAMEIERLVFTGVPPLEALSAATLGGARALGLDDRIGTLEAGKTADIIAIDGDPTEDIRAVRKVTFVMQGGEVRVRRF
jgi:imidazolonepropionase-like amidohydrolase